MILQEDILLAPFTTLGVGGVARFFIEAQTEKDIAEVIVFAREQNLPLFVLGKGSNILVPDTGLDGVVLLLSLRDSLVEENEEQIRIIAGAGTSWEDVVDIASAHGVFGIANLAGIPGSVGGAVVQNIGAYGVEFSEVFDYADVIEKDTGTMRRVSRAEATFAYRTSFLKENRNLIATRLALRLRKESRPNLSYADIAQRATEGAALTTPSEIATVVRSIRALKFPHMSDEGSAGSFFKNPILSHDEARVILEKFPGVPTFPQEDGRLKVSLAWILDHVLALKGYRRGNVRLYEKQPIVVVARAGATATEIDLFAREIEERVFMATGITIEREVETFHRENNF